MEKKYILIILVLIVGCKRYEKKILKVDITTTVDTKFKWEGDADYNACEDERTKSLYLKEGTFINYSAMSCWPTDKGTMTIKVGDKVLFEKTGSGFKVENVEVKRK